MALDTFNPYLFVSSGEQSNKFLTPAYADGIAKFQAQRAQSLTGLTVQINPIQEGSGDPSPTNIRPISGRTGMTVTVQSGETQNEYPVTWETEAGTVYGGTLDVTNGVLTVDRVMWTANTADMNNTEEAPGWRASGIRNIIGTGVSAEYTRAQMNIGSYWAANTNGNNDILFLRTPRYNLNQSEWIALALDVQIIAELATPQTYQLTPTDVRTLAGYNQIYSDAGPVIDIKF